MITVLLITLLLLIWVQRRYSCRNSPPGPWNLPILGYLHKLDPVSPHLTLTKLSRKYGPVYSINLGLMRVAVISDAKIVKKILAMDEALDRPPLSILNSLIFEGKGIVCAPPHIWKDQRKFVITFLKSVGANKNSPNRRAFASLVNRHVSKYVENMKTVTLDPTDLLYHYATDLAGVVLSGRPCLSECEDGRALERLISQANHLAAISGPSNFIPILRFLPQFRKTLSSLKKTLHAIRQIESKLIDETAKSASNSTPNLVEAFLREKSRTQDPTYSPDQLRHLWFDLFGTFAETTAISIMWVLLYLAQHKQVQNKVRQELFHVLQDQTPEIDDLADLNYTNAVIAEVGRIRTIGPLGLPRYTSADVQIEGFTITKGTMIMPLLWAVHMDPDAWQQPEEFRPERFLDEDGKFYKPEQYLPFQAGKRVCVGENAARVMIDLFIAGFVRRFRVEGCDGGVDLDGILGLSLIPKGQKLVFTKIEKRGC